MNPTLESPEEQTREVATPYRVLVDITTDPFIRLRTRSLPSLDAYFVGRDQALSDFTVTTSPDGTIRPPNWRSWTELRYSHIKYADRMVWWAPIELTTRDSYEAFETFLNRIDDICEVIGIPRDPTMPVEIDRASLTAGETKIKEFLLSVKKRPGMYTGQKSLLSLVDLLGGYFSVLKEIDPSSQTVELSRYIPIIPSLTDSLAHRETMWENGGLGKDGNDEVGFDRFVERWDLG